MISNINIVNVNLKAAGRGTSIALPEGWASWQLAVRIYQKSLVGKPAYGPEVFVFDFMAVFHQVMISGFSEEYEHKLTR